MNWPAIPQFPKTPELGVDVPVGADTAVAMGMALEYSLHMQRFKQAFEKAAEAADDLQIKMAFTTDTFGNYKSILKLCNQRCRKHTVAERRLHRINHKVSQHTMVLYSIRKNRYAGP